MKSVSPHFQRQMAAKRQRERFKQIDWLADPKLQGFVGLATLFSLAAGIAFGVVQTNVALTEFSERTALQQDALANEIYLSYINSAIEYPNIAEAVNGDTIGDLSTSDRVRYAWNVEKVLYAAEFVLADGDVPSDWEESFKSEIKRHSYYFNSCEFKVGELPTYMSEVQMLVTQNTVEGCKPTGVKEWQGAYFDA